MAWDVDVLDLDCEVSERVVPLKGLETGVELLTECVAANDLQVSRIIAGTGHFLH